MFTTLRAALQKVLPKDVSLDRSAILLELLRAQHSLRCYHSDSRAVFDSVLTLRSSRADRSTHASFSGVLVQLVACVNVFQTSSIKTRATEGGPTLFHKGTRPIRLCTVLIQENHLSLLIFRGLSNRLYLATHGLHQLLLLVCAQNCGGSCPT